MMRSICVPRHCGLCRFELGDGDCIMAAKQPHTPRLSSPGTLIPLVRRSDTELSQSYEYCTEGLTDDARGIEYVQCRGRCHHDEQRAGCQVDCVEIASPQTLARIIQVTAPTFEPSPIAGKRRLLWLQFWLASILREATRRLPLETCNSIAAWTLDCPSARRLVVEYANEKCAKLRGMDSRVSLLEKIYIRHIEFEGTQYIACLTNIARDS